MRRGKATASCESGQTAVQLPQLKHALMSKAPNGFMSRSTAVSMRTAISASLAVGLGDAARRCSSRRPGRPRRARRTCASRPRARGRRWWQAGGRGQRGHGRRPVGQRGSHLLARRLAALVARDGRVHGRAALVAQLLERRLEGVALLLRSCSSRRRLRSGEDRVDHRVVLVERPARPGRCARVGADGDAGAAAGAQAPG